MISKYKLQSGSVIVESAMSALLFMMILFCTCYISIYCIKSLTLKFALAKAAKKIAVGNLSLQTNPYTQEITILSGPTPYTVNEIRTIVVEEVTKLGIHIQTSNVTVTDITDSLGSPCNPSETPPSTCNGTSIQSDNFIKLDISYDFKFNKFQLSKLDTIKATMVLKQESI